MQHNYKLNNNEVITVVCNRFMQFESDVLGVKIQKDTAREVVNDANLLVDAFTSNSVIALDEHGDTVVLRGIHKGNGAILYTKEGAKLSTSHTRFYAPGAQYAIDRKRLAQIALAEANAELTQHRVKTALNEGDSPFTVPEVS
tara:strand:+ start:1995 stop:2423 length:429 start_codon:yes stop_codon:yes gene_type:complete